ncbi:MAG: penicillin-binding protein 2 [Candidatus Pacebacteria bacterium]|jgi:cell division protein FtsI/penicillin-binding protein 2|nr:penicillin-binding protein 2 [Candidatus Paceibacterota bacterium]
MRAKSEPKLTEDQERRSIDRIDLVILFWLVVALILLGRAFYIQVVKHSHYTSLADRQYVSQAPTNFDRGSIYFSSYKGSLVPAAKLYTRYRLAVTPNQIKDPQGLYQKLSSVLHLDESEFIEKVSKENDPYEEVAKDITQEEVNALRALKVKGLTFIKDNKRSYPQEEVGAKILGFVGSDGVRVKGQYGLERYYDDILVRGSSNVSVNFFAELFADIENNIVSNKDRQEGDVVTTIDAEAARVLHATLKETKETWKSDSIGGIIMDPKTGRILALDALPEFDPNQFSQIKDNSVFLNQNISGVYEMGSIIKPITMAAALDAGAVTLTTTYTDTGFRDLNGYKVRNFDGKARGPGTGMQTILDKSLNVGIVFLVEQLGIDRFQSYFKKFGIGEETGIDLPGEASGLIKNIESKVFVDNATAGFGQGIAITPIQTVRALAALGNGGKLVTPHVTDSIIYKNGEVKKIVPLDGVQVITPLTSEAISRMLVHVVDTALKNGDYKMDRYSIAAKTGTAQMVRPGGGYYEDRYLHSFFGYFPAYEPRFIIFLFHTYPKGAEYASATLTDPFFKLVKFLISYYEVPPDR